MWWFLGLAWASPAREAFLARQALVVDPNDPARWTRLAELEPDPLRAQTLYREALRLDSDWVPALVGLGQGLAEAGDPGEGVRVLLRAQQLAPEAVETALALASVQGDAAQARALWARFPERPEVALLVARLDPPGARAVLAQAPPTPDVLVALTEVRLAEGDAAGAAAALSQIGEPPAQLSRWVACAQAGTLSAQGYRALIAARRGALARPGAASQGALPEGTERCAAALAQQAQLSNGREAERWLRAALALSPDADLALALARVLLELGEAGQALTLIETNPPGDELLYARALRDLQQPDRAREILRRAAQDQPDRVDLVLLRAELALTPAEGLQILLEALGRLADPALEARARALAESLDQLEALQRALFEEPVAMQRRLADVGDYEEVVVIGKRESVLRLEELVTHLRGLGYGEPTVLADGTVSFAAVDLHHPWVKLFPDGSYDAGMRRMTRKDNLSRMALMDGMSEELVAWRSALCREAVEDRLVTEIPAGLDALWREGVPISGVGHLKTQEERKAALLEWWVTRTCTPEGDMVREVIARYLVTEVQPSAWPVTADELVAVNARRLCSDPLVLP